MRSVSVRSGAARRALVGRIVHLRRRREVRFLAGTVFETRHGWIKLEVSDGNRVWVNAEEIEEALAS